MENIENDRLTIHGGTYQLKIQTIFPDVDEEKYEHSIGWIVEPSISNEKTAFQLTGVIHKKYWQKLDIDPFETTPDKSFFTDKYGWLSGPYSSPQFPTQMRHKLGEIFGINKAQKIGESTEETTSLQFPQIPTEAINKITSCVCRVDAGYNSQHKNQNQYNHSFSWWFEPKKVGDKLELQLTEAFHKKWKTAVSRKPKVKYSQETIEEYVSPDEPSKPITSVPTTVQEHLQDVFAEKTVVGE